MVSRVPVVLLVEDDPGDVLMVTEALERSQVPPVLYVAGDGHEAMQFLYRDGEHARAPRPDLILLDLNMPRMDGRETLAAIKANEWLRAIPVVVLTTSDAEADVLTSYQRHASAFVTKPMDLEDLETVVDQISHFYTGICTLLPPEQRASGTPHSPPGSRASQRRAADGRRRSVVAPPGSPLLWSSHTSPRGPAAPDHGRKAAMGNVLVLDDDSDHRLLIRTWLEKMGHHVTTAGTAAEAFLVLAGGPVPDLAVLDVVMPQVDGVQFLRNLRQDPEYTDMPVIFLTAADLPAHPEQDWAEHALYVTKPLARAVLTAAVKEAFTTSPGPHSASGARSAARSAAQVDARESGPS